MNIRIFAVSALALGLAHSANATVYFDSTMPSTNPYSGTDGQADGNSYSAASFSAGQPDFTQISLILSASNPTDGGSVMVYLVPDNGTGGSPGVAGNPGPLQDAALLTTISDSSLSVDPSLVTINLSGSVASSVSTENDEYWVWLQYSDGSSTLWSYGDSDIGGIGLTGQGNVDESFPTNNPDSDGVYDMVVDTPEPASLAILGGGLAGLGYLRRRKVKKGQAALDCRSIAPV
jgi:hypothetical protein